MSAANVKFYTLDYDSCELTSDKPVYFGFRCPKSKVQSYCGGLLIAGASDIKHDPQGQNGGRPQWSFDGDRESPTFAPSVNCGGCGWHGFIEKGRCVDTSKKDEP